MMEEQLSAVEEIVSRSREISEERWATIKAELEDSKGAAHLALEACSRSSRADDVPVTDQD